jgi:hypothetical protein
MSEPVAVTAVWLRKVGSDVDVLLEIDGVWRLVIQELDDGNYSHIVEESGIRSAEVGIITGLSQHRPG